MTDDALLALGNAVNAELEAEGAPYRLSYAEWMSGGDDEGQTLFFSNVGNKRLEADFVPGDPRRGGRTNITYIVDQVDGAVDGLTAEQTTAAIDRAMGTWNSVACSVIPITRVDPIAGQDIGIFERSRGLGGSPIAFADIMHAGWVPQGVLAIQIVGVTFTYTFGTDIDNNKYDDVFFREILYNDAYPWRINANHDVETVALHEAGHGLSQAHFGQRFRTDANGMFHFAPRAVMNAGYTGVMQQLMATDEAGHCANWAGWPRN